MSEESEFSDESTGGWIHWFCNYEDHQFFCQVDDEFIRDNFNLYGIKQKFAHFNDAVAMILRPEPPDEEELENEKFLELYQEATDIYGLIHARFILTPKGLALMREKFLLGKFGVCPRVLCQRQNVLPIGMSEDIRTSRVKVYCPRCQDVYMPKKKYTDVDGAYFGCSFPHILLMTYEDLLPTITPSSYVPKVFGFKLYKKKGSRYHDQKKQQEITHYSEEHLKKIKTKTEPNANKKGQKTEGAHKR